MKKFLLFFLLSFVLVSCGSKNTDSITGSGEVALTTEKVTTESAIDAIKNAPNSLVNTENFNACVKPYVNMCLEQTATEQARTTKNAEVCNELKEESQKNSCRFGVILSDISELKTTEKCDALTDNALKNACKSAIINFVATDTSDAKRCDELTTIYTNVDELKSAKNSCMLSVLTRKSTLKKEECSVLDDESSRKMCESFAETTVTTK